MKGGKEQQGTHVSLSQTDNRFGAKVCEVGKCDPALTSVRVRRTFEQREELDEVLVDAVCV